MINWHWNSDVLIPNRSDLQARGPRPVSSQSWHVQSDVTGFKCPYLVTRPADLTHPSLIYIIPCLFTIAHSQPEHEIYNDSRKKGNRQDGRAETIIEATLSSHADTPRAPMECEQRVYHGHHSDQGE